MLLARRRFLPLLLAMAVLATAVVLSLPAAAQDGKDNGLPTYDTAYVPGNSGVPCGQMVRFNHGGYVWYGEACGGVADLVVSGNGSPITSDVPAPGVVPNPGWTYQPGVSYPSCRYIGVYEDDRVVTPSCGSSPSGSSSPSSGGGSPDSGDPSDSNGSSDHGDDDRLDQCENEFSDLPPHERDFLCSGR
ncbi:MAG: hypothetical protein F4124_10575 [Acidimicrobiia bacterium]|nr:hypothetical protein [Acidimicrobiia bacterium]MYB72888.1 hypothetical protein [Acidimicrobiia bacterium]MYH99861.1 hypothetical protein [Acidimicrobiia bacterium]